MRTPEVLRSALKVLGEKSTSPELDAELLLAELQRAELHAPDDMPANTVVMNAFIDFVDQGNGTQRTVQLAVGQGRT